MLFALGIVATAGATLVTVAHRLSKAPEGYEDQDGFHLLKRTRGSAVIRRRVGHAAEAGALRSARVHP